MTSIFYQSLLRLGWRNGLMGRFPNWSNKGLPWPMENLRKILQVKLIVERLLPQRKKLPNLLQSLDQEREKRWLKSIPNLESTQENLQRVNPPKYQRHQEVLIPSRRALSMKERKWRLSSQSLHLLPLLLPLRLLLLLPHCLPLRKWLPPLHLWGISLSTLLPLYARHKWW